MSPIILQILFYCLMPIGVFLLIKGIRMLIKTFNGAVIIEIPFTQREALFSIEHAGSYAIWQRGKAFISRKSIQVTNFDLKLTKTSYGPVPVRDSTVSLHVNGFGSGRVEWKRFDADYGNYKLELQERSASSGGFLNRLFSGGSVDHSQYSIQIRESQPTHYMFLAMLLNMVSLALIIGGLVLGMNAKTVAISLGLV